MKCYRNCINSYRNESKWIGFIDIDEFVVPNDMNSIYDFLKKFDYTAGAVKIYWKMFGMSGMINRDLSKFVTEQFFVSWPRYNVVGKCFYNTRFEFDMISQRNGSLHHLLWMRYKGRIMPPADVFGNLCINNSSVTISNEHPIQINHYFTKSYQEYISKRNKGDVYFKLTHMMKDFLYSLDEVHKR